MAIDFHSPSYRASSSDLTVSVSPLGLVELADEEFEVHGPRLNRYAHNWAFYLGHHWGYKREHGEPQLTFNYVKAFADYINNFTFGKGVGFRSPKATEAIVPQLLQRVWEEDNDKESVLWEMGNQGGVSGDCFVKVAWDPPFADPVGQVQPGRIRILPLNASYCLPVEDTEVLTRRGWLSANDLTTDDEALALDPGTDELVWTDVQAVNVFDWDGPMARWRNERFDALSTPDHRWLAQSARGKRSIRTTADLHELQGGGAGSLVVAGGTPMAFSPLAKHDDDFVETVGWFVTEGHWHTQNRAPMFTQDEQINPEHAARIDRLAKAWGGSVYRFKGKATQWYVPSLRESLHSVVGDQKALTAEFLGSLTYSQARLLYETLLDGDGHRGVSTVWAQSDEGRVDGFQMLAMMLGLRTQARWRQRDIGKRCSDVTVYKNRTLNIQNLKRTTEHYQGKVWCPTTGTGTWVARRKGTTFHTGNCFPEWHPHDRNRLIRFKMKYRFWGTALEGTRQVFTYVELMTDEAIEEYINDELIDSRPNPLGRIPVAFIPNIPVSGSPWGLSDIQDIISLNREYNEKATDISDIINYHAAPVTVITGAKASQLEKGPKKVWGGLPKDASVFNLELAANLAGPMQYLEMIKRSMHELTGVPESALGQFQPISNTSGVALSIQFQPLMNRYSLKKTTYGRGINQINDLILRHIALYQPEAMQWDATNSTVLKDGQIPVLDPLDPITYRTTLHWPPPLPIDELVKLNEIQMKQGLGLESKRGALRDLGYEFPEEKMQEIFDELVEDAKEQGALDLLNATITSSIMKLTGMVPPTGPVPAETDDEGNVTSAGGSGVTTAAAAPAAPIPAIDPAETMEQIVTLAYGTKIPQRRNPNNDN